ncbi:hypothetical protein [Halorhodospira halochloris]|uniref:hypothetical protein n=1 Tax=Halorhodospira halochloris TaxID=1052 RepID=UPI001EE8AD98|nr:hypothetical protein [Halorhodospira halochloris]MCG5549219.1 hypothetical protein [Halorhodospira halochloris]
MHQEQFEYEWTTASVALDDALGGEVRGSSEVALQVAEAQLRALDVVDCPQLEMLDLQEAAPGVVVTVSGCPRLRYLKLPDHAPGSTVYWDYGGKGRVDLALDGAIDEIDLNLRGEALGIPQRCGSQPWFGARITDSSSIPDPLAADVLYWLDPICDEHTQEQGQPVSPTSRERACAHVMLTKEQTPKALIIRREKLRLLSISERAELEQLHIMCPSISCIKGSEGYADIGPSGIQRLAIDSAANLSTLCASGHSLDLRNCGGALAPVTLYGGWAQIKLADTSLHLGKGCSIQKLQGIGELTVEQHPFSRRLSRVPHSTHATDKRLDAGHMSVEHVFVLLEATEDGDIDASGLLWNWVQQAVREHVHYALQVLWRLAQLMPDRATLKKIWRLRCRLRHKVSRRSTLGISSNPSGVRLNRHVKGEMADRQLAVFCRHHGINVISDLVAETKLGHLSVLRLEASWLKDEAQRKLADEVLRRCLEQWQDRRPARRQGEEMREQVLDALRLGSRARADAVTKFIARNIDDELALELLQPFVERGHVPSRTHVMAIGLGKSSQFAKSLIETEKSSGLRQQAMHLALSKPLNNQLAQPSESDSAQDFAA